MNAFDNGGAYAIKGFNYQKSVVMLIAVLHFLDVEDFKIYVETKDDIVFTSSSGAFYMQAKSSEMNTTTITTRRKGSQSIIEKNISHGTEDSDIYKIISPRFKDQATNLKKIDPALITKGAKVFQYTDTAIKKIEDRLPGISKEKLERARVVLTEFDEDQTEALFHIQGIMTSMGIPVDNNHGLRSLEELIKEIDQRSAIVVESEEDYEKKMFTPKDLSNIFSHSHKQRIFLDIVGRLNYNVAKSHALIEKRVSVAALYGSVYSEAEEIIKNLDIVEVSETEVIAHALEVMDFKSIDDTLTREAIVIDAFSRVIYERDYL